MLTPHLQTILTVTFFLFQVFQRVLENTTEDYMIQYFIEYSALENWDEIFFPHKMEKFLTIGKTMFVYCQSMYKCEPICIMHLLCFLRQIAGISTTKNATSEHP